jgi:hypothetical protein
MSTTTTHSATDGQASVAVPATGFLQDYQNAIREYVDDYVTITIDEVDFDGNVLNTNEVGTYQVEIHNAGPLRMRNVSVTFRGLNGTLVKGGGALAQFEPEWTFEEMIEKIGPGGRNRIAPGTEGDTPQHLSFKAPSTPSGRQELLEVTIHDFDADLDPVHNRDNGGGSGTWSKRVVDA